MKKQKDKQDESGTEIPGFWERLDSELFKKHGSANEISRKTIVAGYPIGKETIYAIQVKRSMPNTMTFWRLYKTLGINIHYIITGEGGLPKPNLSMITEAFRATFPKDDLPDELVQLFKKVPEKRKDAVIELIKNML